MPITTQQMCYLEWNCLMLLSVKMSVRSILDATIGHMKNLHEFVISKKMNF